MQSKLQPNGTDLSCSSAPSKGKGRAMGLLGGYCKALLSCRQHLGCRRKQALQLLLLLLLLCSPCIISGQALSSSYCLSEFLQLCRLACSSKHSRHSCRNSDKQFEEDSACSRSSQHSCRAQTSSGDKTAPAQADSVKVAVPVQASSTNGANTVVTFTQAKAVGEPVQATVTPLP